MTKAYDILKTTKGIPLQIKMHGGCAQELSAFCRRWTYLARENDRQSGKGVEKPGEILDGQLLSRKWPR